MFDHLGLRVDSHVPELGRTLGEALLEPHRSYLGMVKPILDYGTIKGMAHITGGGITDNLPRILPRDTHALIRVGSWPLPELFHFLQEQGEVEAEEMFRVFNMGIGMILAVEPSGLAEVLSLLRSTGQRSFLIGTVQKEGSGVVYDLESTVS